MKRLERRRAIGLVPVGRNQRVVLAVGERRAPAVLQGDRGMLHVRRREHRVRVVRRRAEPAGERQQMLALLVEHVLLLVIQPLDGEPVHRQVGVGGHPAADGVERNAQQLGSKPRSRLFGFRKEDLHPLAASVGLVVALVLVVIQAGVIPELVGQLSKIIFQQERLQHARRPFSKRAFQLGIAGQLALELLQRAFPCLPAGINIREIPGEMLGNVVTGAGTRLLRRRFGWCGIRHRWILIDS